MIDEIEGYRDQIAALCRRYGVKRLELFGSAAAATFDPVTSDIDFFYEFDPNESRGLADRFFDFQEAMERLIGKHVDLVSSRDVTNPYFLQVANRNRRTIYAA